MFSFYIIFFAPEKMKKHPQKLLTIDPQFFFYIGNDFDLKIYIFVPIRSSYLPFLLDDR